jgi:beta-galactosidase
VGTKQQFPGSPAWGSEYWGTGEIRTGWDYELGFAAPFLNDWHQSVAANAFGMAQWYLADTPGEIGTQTDGTPDANVCSIADSMMDANRFPRLLYYIYEAAWTPYSLKPVVALAHHWNRNGNIQVNAFSSCPAVRPY